MHFFFLRRVNIGPVYVCRRGRSGAAAEPDGVVAEVDQRRVPTVRAFVDAARRIHAARPQVQVVRDRRGRIARLPQTSRGSGCKL